MPECFASVLTLAHRRFRTEVPGPLLAVSEPKGEGKGKGKTNERGSMNRRGCVATMVSVVVDPVAEADEAWDRGVAVGRPKRVHEGCPKEHRSRGQAVSPAASQ